MTTDARLDRIERLLLLIAEDLPNGHLSASAYGLAVEIEAARQQRQEPSAAGAGAGQPITSIRQFAREWNELTAANPEAVADELRMPSPVAPAQDAEATVPEQGGGGATAAASRPPLDAQIAAVETSLADAKLNHAKWLGHWEDHDDYKAKASSERAMAALSAAAETLRAVPGLVEALNEAADKFHVLSFYISDEQARACAVKTKEMIAALAGMPKP